MFSTQIVPGSGFRYFNNNLRQDMNKASIRNTIAKSIKIWRSDDTLICDTCQWSIITFCCL